MRVRVIGASDAAKRARSPAGMPPEHAEVGGGPRRSRLQPFKVGTFEGVLEGARQTFQ